MTRKRLVIVAVLLVPACALTLIMVDAVADTPGNEWLLILVFVAGPWAFTYFALPVLLFLVLTSCLSSGRPKIPASSIALLILGVIAVAAYFLMSWHEGMQYQGASSFYLLVAANLAMILLLVFWVLRNQRNPRLGSTLLFIWLLVLWLSSFAFPPLGELPD